MRGAPRWYVSRAETDRAQLLSWLRWAEADLAAEAAEECDQDLDDDPATYAIE